ncbi:uncharacterized protein [Cherax quadricarinatus]|uniref:uncharacterized protein n=1 Tax=Cherax quadricarinatus TaxID=27406 RepID=UPI002379CF28|nr:uncharacterized protein LOC128689779 [Cherax quadricarinatus]
MPSALTETVVPGASAATIMQQVDQSLRTFGFDLKSLVKALDLQTIGILTLVVVLAIVLYDIISYNYSSYHGDLSSYSSYGRSLVTTAAKVWDQREELGLNPYVRGGRGLDEMTRILDAVADAILKYEDTEVNKVPSSRKSKDMQIEEKS